MAIMKGVDIRFIALSVCSAVLLSLGWLVPHCGAFVLIGFVPLLWMDRLADAEGRKGFWKWHYLTFVLWNALTTYWVCNATVAGGLFAIFANAFQMSVIWAIFRYSKKYLQSSVPYIFLAAMWIAWERFYFDAEISWPWLVLGNAFGRTTSCVQWYEATGLLGGSLWAWASNLGIFGLMCALESGRWKTFNIKAKAAAASAMALLYILPLSVSWTRYAHLDEKDLCGKLEVCVLQPNLDPYQKFESLSQAQQNGILMSQIGKEAAKADIDLFIAPETFTNDILLNNPEQSASLQTFRKTLSATGGSKLLFGASAYKTFDQANPPSWNARQIGPGRWYESYNAAVLCDSCAQLEVYKKSKLVVGVEKMPYPRITRHLEKIPGVYIGRCVGQEETQVLNCGAPMGCAVCYESIYPEHFASYVKRGAKAMSVITNDAWWGNTAGYKQHLSYSCLRAIETRRAIARSANTGISAFINKRGDIVCQTEWWERTQLCGSLPLYTELTPFVMYGDITGKLCTFIFILLLALVCVRRLLK